MKEDRLVNTIPDTFTKPTPVPFDPTLTKLGPTPGGGIIDAFLRLLKWFGKK